MLFAETVKRMDVFMLFLGLLPKYPRKTASE
jgi:hypothetical protein